MKRCLAAKRRSKILIEQVNDRFYLLDAAAKEIGCSPVTLWRWIRGGRLEVLRIGREVLIEKKAIEVLRK